MATGSRAKSANKKGQGRKPLNLLLILFVLLGAISIWVARGRPLPGWAGQSEKSAPVQTKTAGDPVLESVHVRVLNATEVSGLAAEFALLLPPLNCVVQGVGNAANWPGGKSVLINRRLPRSQAEQLAERLGGLLLIREWDGRTTEDAVLVLGEDYAQLKEFLRVGASSH